MAVSRFPPTVLLDTGAAWAILDKNDDWHSPCRAEFVGIDVPLLTSEAVLAELFHLATRARVETEIAWNFVRSGTVTIGTIPDGDLPDLRQLMDRYADRPIEFADATPVHLARRQSVSTIFTIDHSDFETYRIEGKRKFRVLPAKRT